MANEPPERRAGPKPGPRTHASGQPRRPLGAASGHGAAAGRFYGLVASAAAGVTTPGITAADMGGALCLILSPSR